MKDQSDTQISHKYSKIQNKNNYKVLTMTKAIIFLIGIKDEILVLFLQNPSPSFETV